MASRRRGGAGGGTAALAGASPKAGHHHHHDPKESKSHAAPRGPASEANSILSDSKWTELSHQPMPPPGLGFRLSQLKMMFGAIIILGFLIFWDPELIKSIISRFIAFMKDAPLLRITKYLLVAVTTFFGLLGVLLYRAFKKDGYVADTYATLMMTLIGEGLARQKELGPQDVSMIPIPTSSPSDFKPWKFKIDHMEFWDGIDDAPGQVRTKFEMLLIRLIRDWTPLKDIPAAWSSVDEGNLYYARKLAPHCDRGVDWSTIPGGCNSDRALELLVFQGMGGHQLERVGTSREVLLPLNHCTKYEVREGLDNYGGDAYFDADTQKLLRIVYKDKTYKPGDAGWERVKMIVKTTLNVLVVIGSHFVQTHMIWGQSAALATRASLGPRHPLRRFMALFTYRTLAINASALETLISEKGMVHRVAGLTWSGLKQFVDDEVKSPRVSMQSFENGLNARGVTTDFIPDSKFPWRDDKQLMVNAVRTLVKRYVALHWPLEEDVQSDPEIQLFWKNLRQYDYYADRFTEAAEGDRKGASTAPRPLSRLNLELYLEKFVLAVTVEHEDYGGRTPTYFWSGDFCGSRIWKEGKGPVFQDKQTTAGLAMITMITALRMPALVGNVYRLMRDEKASAVLREFQIELCNIIRVIELRNRDKKLRDIPCRIFDPLSLESSVSI